MQNQCTAFQVTEEDIENVLRECWVYVGNTDGKSFRAIAEDLLGQIGTARIEKAALNSGADLEDQTRLWLRWAFSMTGRFNHKQQPLL